MLRSINKVFTLLKEHTYVSYAKFATIGGFCDLDHIVVKATSPCDTPLPDRYVHEILQIFAICPSSFGSFVLSFSRRFGNTECWRVALKCLALLHRLLKALPYTSPFRDELLLARSNGLVSLYPHDFKNRLSSASQDYANFIWSYARLLDESLDCCATQAKENDFIDKMDEVRLMLEVLPQLQSLLDSVMACRPTGQAKRTAIVQSVMKYVIRDSFTCYITFRKHIVEVLDHLIQLPYINCVAAFEIYKKAANQANELCEFYEWCKCLGLCGMYEYPFIDKIPQIQITALENFLNGMWQSTDDPSSSTSTDDSNDYKQKHSMLFGPSKNVVALMSDPSGMRSFGGVQSACDSISEEFEQHRKQETQSTDDRNLFGPSKDVVVDVLDPLEMHRFWGVQSTFDSNSEEFEQHRKQETQSTDDSNEYKQKHSMLYGPSKNVVASASDPSGMRSFGGVPRMFYSISEEFEQHRKQETQSTDGRNLFGPSKDVVAAVLDPLEMHRFWGVQSAFDSNSEELEQYRKQETQSTDDSNDYKQKHAMLFGPTKNVVALMADPSGMHSFWKVQSIEFEQHRKQEPQSTDDSNDYKRKHAMLFGPSKNIVAPVSDPSEMHGFWGVPSMSDSIFEEFEQHGEMQPLIQLEDDNQDWETLLDACVSLQTTTSTNNFYIQNNAYQYAEEWKDQQKNGWEIQVYQTNKR
ncbi:putative clathrin assembly protein [Capsicum chacoense]